MVTRASYFSRFRYISVVLSFILVLGVLSGCTAKPILVSGYEPPAASSSPSSESPQPQQLKVRFSAVGDNLIHTSLYLQAKERAGGDGYNFEYAYDNVRSFFQDFDINMINQETLVSDEIEPSSYPLFCSPGEVAEEANRAGWNVFTMSNNHIYDKGAEGVASTLRFWDTMPEDVVSAGLFKNTEDDSGISIQEINGISFAYLAFAENTNGIPQPANVEARVVLTSEVELMERLIKRANELADVVVVALHWGVEYSHGVTDGQRELAKNVVAWGADLIVGGHPHVIAPVEWITNPENGRKVLVAYSLGNFISAQANGPRMIGLAMTMDFLLTLNPDGTKSGLEVQNVKFYPTVTHYGSSYSNVTTYMLQDYTDELAAQHGCQQRDGAGTFTREYIQNLVDNVVDAEFLA